MTWYLTYCPQYSLKEYRYTKWCPLARRLAKPLIHTVLGHVWNATSISFLICIWSDSLLCFRNRGEGYWHVTPLCLLADNESSHLPLCNWVWMFFCCCFLLQKPSFSHICGFCAKKNAVLIGFSIIMLSELIFNYDSIHVYQENPAIEYL